MKTEQTFTPGPWTYDSTWSLIMAGEHEIAAIHAARDLGDKRKQAGEVAANARLIAAAPDLLEALKLCQVRLFMLDGANEEYNLAGDAITKATGAKPV